MKHEPDRKGFFRLPKAQPEGPLKTGGFSQQGNLSSNQFSAACCVKVGETGVTPLHKAAAFGWAQQAPKRRDVFKRPFETDETRRRVAGVVGIRVADWE